MDVKMIAKDSNYIINISVHDDLIYQQRQELLKVLL